MGRPTKLTADVQERICQKIREGNYYEAACAFAGVDYATFRRWMEKGETANTGPFREFCEAIQRAVAEAEVAVVAQWQADMPGNWQASRDFLARRFPDRWGPRERKELTGKGGGPISTESRIIILPAKDRESTDDDTAAG